MKKSPLLIALAAILLLAGCDALFSPTDESNVPHAVEYRVTGTVSDALITWTNASGGTSQNSAAPLPWSFSFTTPAEFTFLYVSAQNNYGAGSITAEIYVDGSLYQTSTSSGAYVIASASGSVGHY